MPPRTILHFLAQLTGDESGIQRRIDAGEVLLADGTPVSRTTAYQSAGVVYLYRDLPDEPPVPGDLPVLLHDEETGLLAVDKPPFLATMPRGSHVAQTAVVRLRRELDLPELAPVHRLDRLTSGVLLLTTRRAARSSYQRLVQVGGLTKTYEALAPIRDDLALPVTLTSRIIKERGHLQAQVVDGPPNATTQIQLIGTLAGRGHYRLTPTTGRTHQLRLHLATLGIPIDGDPLYPRVIDTAPGDFSTPLQLLAAEVTFTDPVTGQPRHVRSPRTMPIPAPGDAASDG